MTVSQTPRLGLITWDSDDDAWSREDFAANNAALEAGAVIFEHADYSPESSSDPLVAGKFWRQLKPDGTVEQLWYCDGATWRRVALLDGPSAINGDPPATWDNQGLMLTVHNLADDSVAPGNMSVRYRHAYEGNTDTLVATIVIGSTTTLGGAGGALAIRGITADVLSAAGIDLRIPALFRDASTGDLFDGIAYLPASDASQALLYVRNAAGKLTPVTTAAPFAWAADDSITLGPVPLAKLPA